MQNRALILFSFATILLFADQNLLSPNLTAIANEFGFNDIERDIKLGGDISIAFYLLGAPASYIVGCLGDVYPRTPLFVLMIFFGEGACAATYWSSTYRGLYICRALTGLSIGGAMPLIFSLLGDLYPADQRNGVSAFISMGMGLGIGLGQGVAGYLGPTFGWRLPFLLVSIPAMSVAVCIGLFVKDPERGQVDFAALSLLSDQSEQNFIPIEDEENQEKRIQEEIGNHLLMEDELSKKNALVRPTNHLEDGKKVKSEQIPSVVYQNENLPEDYQHHHSISSIIYQYVTKTYRGCTNSLQSACNLLRTKTFFLLILQGIPGCIPWGIINVYLTDYLSTDKGMSIEYATTTNLLFGVGVFLGMFASGFSGNYLYSRSPKYPSILAGSTAILGCIPFYILINAISNKTSIYLAFFISITGGICTGIAGPIVKATLTNTVTPNQRSQGFAIFNIFNDLGIGLGPFFAALLIEAFNGNRTKAFNIGTIAWILCGIINLSIFWTVEKDEEKIQSLILEELRSTRHPQPGERLHEDSSAQQLS